MKIGLTLSGGGARGIAHLGVLQALEEFGIRPERIAGVSSGAIVGALYANGYSPEEILEIATQTRIFPILRPSSFRQPGIFNLSKVEKTILKHIPHNSFEGLGLPLTVAATDVNKGELMYFDSGNYLSKALIASACVPVMFTPVVFQGRSFVDGGIISSMIVKPLRGNVDKIIGVHTNPFDPGQPLRSTRSLLERCLTLSIHANARANFSDCNVVIEPLALKTVNAFRVDKAEEIFQIGYEEAQKHKEELMALKSLDTTVDE